MIILGLMSGTSLDGVDLALCDVEKDSCKILDACTYPYPDHWKKRLSTISQASAFEYARTNVDLGRYFAELICQFDGSHQVFIEAIASHGHTVFHQPDIGLTTQIGDGETIAAITNKQVVYNFRALDVALGGQGAPLVPMGDEILFGEYDACLNLGGIANISFRDTQGDRVAFDICPCNMALNFLAQKEGLDYDKDGELAKRGKCDKDLLQWMNSLDYYCLGYPKSLGREWFDSYFLPLIDRTDLSTADLLCTTIHHIAHQIASVLKENHILTLLITGGGAFNEYLIDTLLEYADSCYATIPDDDIVNYKEAMIFALLGYLRLNNMPNTYCSVTGAYIDSIGGSVSGRPFHLPPEYNW